MLLTHRLQSKRLAVNGTLCVRFAYYIHGGTGGQLRVYNGRAGPDWPFFTVRGGQEGQWQITAVTTTGFKYNDQVNNVSL